MARKEGNLPAAMRRGHDHGRCIEEALTLAAELCAGRGARLTDLRRGVLELVWQSHAPLGAYAILDLLSREGRKPMPPTVYRALDFLLQQKLIHRIASLNAYIGCIDPGRPHSGQHLICRLCGTVAEVEEEAISGAIAASARSLQFSIERQTVEVTGICVNCVAD
jgi:Fur family zinc uptake transcriptional regulator